MYKTLATLLAALTGAALAAEPQTLTLQDQTGRGFPPDLVNYTIDAPKDGGKSLRVLDAAGKPLPVQVTPAEEGQATLSFVAELAPGSAATYTLRTDGPAAPAAVSAKKDRNTLVLANQSLAVKLPAPQQKTFDAPVAADTLPAPILAFRGPDGQWKGEGKSKGGK